MPIHEFECSACGNVFERLQKLSDADPVDCPECGKPKIRRRLSAPAFRLAGSGWYETDFKKDGEKKHNLAGRADEPKGKTDGESAGKSGTQAASPAADATPAAKPAANTPSAD